jgi:hypothetical protein
VGGAISSPAIGRSAAGAARIAAQKVRYNFRTTLHTPSRPKQLCPHRKFNFTYLRHYLL